jgi:penicillin-binding protein 1C
VCANSGQLPTPRCEHVVDDLYSISHSSTRTCEIDKELLVSSDEKTSYCPSCLGVNAYHVVNFVEYPPELLSFWSESGVAYRRSPPHNPACFRLFGGEGPKIAGLANEMTYYIQSIKQKLALQATSALDVKEHIWYVNEQFFARSRVGEKLFVSLKDGEHTLTCLDDKGRMSSVHIKVKYML